MKRRALCLIIFSFALTISSGLGQTEQVYRNEEAPISARVRDLLGRMTLAEKVGQLNMPCVYESGLGGDIPEKRENCKRFAAGNLVEGIGPAGGFFTLANTILRDGPAQQAEYFNELQRIAIHDTRLGIPLLQTEEGTHGLMCSGGTIFPEGLALGSTWNLDLIEQIYKVVALEGRSVGIHQLFTLVIEPYRDPRLGRNQEGYSEDPYYSARIASRIVQAVQGDDISKGYTAVAGFCHYPGQSEPMSGLERGAMDISERVLRNVFLPPWVAAIKHGGALGIMATYPAIDGTPVHASSWILDELLRGELGFEGLVLSEGGGIETLVYEGLAPTQKEAGQLALRAGVDVGISFEDGYMRSLIESVEEGVIPVSLVDRAVARILGLKFKLGLFRNPFVDVERAVSVSNRPPHRELALQAAREGIVLLKNQNNLLPLSKEIGSIAVIGPNADDMRNQLGDYTSHSILQDVVTVLEGIQNHVSEQTTVEYVRGCDVLDTSWNEFDRVREVASNADVSIVVLGENEWQSKEDGPTSGEGFDVASLDLTGLQEELVKTVVATGKPTVVVLVNGRPLSTRWISENVPAVVESWCSGEEGGNAIAEVLFGEYNPSGRLPVTIPRHVGQLPVYYNHKKSKRYWIEKGWGKAYADMSPDPLYRFGHGLSYTSFEYRNLKISSPTFRAGGSTEISLELSNTGRRDGVEVVQLYVEDLVSSVATPVMELRGFERVQLKPGESKRVTFKLNGEELALLDKDLNRVTEPGVFKVMLGHSSGDIRLTGEIEVVR